jgi:hypothetical protein
MRASRCLPLVLGGMTLIVLLGNALPTSQRKHRLQRVRRVLLKQTRDESARTIRVNAEIAAMRDDAFYIERLYSEAWRIAPQGAILLNEVDARPDFAE